MPKPKPKGLAAELESSPGTEVSPDAGPAKDSLGQGNKAGAGNKPHVGNKAGDRAAKSGSKARFGDPFGVDRMQRELAEVGEHMQRYAESSGMAAPTPYKSSGGIAKGRGEPSWHLLDQATGSRGAEGRWTLGGERYRFESQPYLDMAAFALGRGFVVTGGREGGHNVGSPHDEGRAIDVRVSDKSSEDVEEFMAEARSHGMHVRDERTHPPGQKVWSGPHLHLSVPRGDPLGVGMRLRDRAGPSPTPDLSRGGMLLP